MGREGSWAEQCKIKSPKFSSPAEVAMSVTYFFVRNFATLVCLCVLCISTSFLCVNTNKAPPKPQNNLKTKNMSKSFKFIHKLITT